MADGLPLGIEATRLLEIARGSDGRRVVHVTGGEGRAEEIARALRALAPEWRADVFPPWDCLPYDFASPSPAAMGRRMSLLRRLGDEDGPRLVVTTPAALLQRVPPVGAARAHRVCVGEPLDAEALRAFCEEAGYRVDERVDEPGEVAIRGGVVDLFDPDGDWPYRIEFNGGVAAIRRYDPATQRSVEELDELAIDAASELPGGAGDEEEQVRGAEHWLPEAYPALATLLDHAPDARLVAGPGAGRARRAVLDQIAEAHRERERLGSEGGRRVLPPERLYLSEEEWQGLAEAHDLARLDDGGWREVPAFAEARRLRDALAPFLAEQAESGRRLVLASAGRRDAGRLARRVREAGGAQPESARTWEEALAAPPGATLAIEAPLDGGFVDERAGVAVLAARDVLGSRAGGDEALAAAAPWQIEAAELHPGDVVVHEEHGVARLDGLEAMAGEGLEGEAIRLAYAGGQVLLVPSDEAGKVWRYGSEDVEVPLDRLDTNGWEKRRAKADAALAETAKALIAAAAEREAREAPRLAPERAPYEKVAARFPYEETPDQARAIRAVLEDMASGTPMNRLVIGDVGFGKTEVAIRAAAACAFAGRQVAVIAPTTVLARQHVLNFRRRFEGTGVEVGHLSRLVSPAEARRVKAALADGSLRIVVGTHAVLGKGVAFADLALAIVDEEQRLGDADKRKARTLAGDGHFLAMTATPIPRTLQSALVGVQDLSVIATPPARRRPIRTLLAERDPATLRQAILRERRRGGQSFVVVPRVEDIAPTAEELGRLLPRLSVRVAHGQLPAREIDEVMVGFAEGEGDVLLATSIIESGLDVPRANTMVVLRPDLFGLAQLHQLRGRVGRSNAQAFCYLMTEAGEELPPATLRRLGTLQALDRLGAGMAISAQDLDLRGGGELFGDRQSGHVRLIGLALYQELLAQAVRAARGEPAGHREVGFRAEATGHLPASYIPEPEVRLNLYHRLARTGDAGDVDRLAAEVADRFGPPPPPVRDLLRAATIRALARTLGVSRISAGPQAVALDFEPGTDPEERFADALARIPDLEWNGGRLVLGRPGERPEERAGIVLGLLEELA